MKVKVNVKSMVDGEVYGNECFGEYKFDNGEHRLAYSDLSGNMITNNYLHIRKDSLFLKREGGFEGEMLFDPMCDTVLKYSVVMLEGGFVLHTYEYSLVESENGFTIKLSYGLNDGYSEEIHGQQIITAAFSK